MENNDLYVNQNELVKFIENKLNDMRKNVAEGLIDLILELESGIS